ncbi:acylphosphatase [bacterium]|nr:acylphosphatase [bacterium]
MSRSPENPQPTGPPAGGQAAVHAMVRGRVQGVGFRYFVVRQANKLELGGWTRNTEEGDVEVYAVGGRDALQQLIDALERGPAFARVDAVKTNWNVPVEPAGEFYIRP